MQRIKKDSLVPETDLVTANFLSAEDVILSKLQWYKAGAEVSDRQWLDILGVIKVKSVSLDKIYLSQWADYLEVYELLIKAFGECEIKFIQE